MTSEFWAMTLLAATAFTGWVVSEFRVKRLRRELDTAEQTVLKHCVERGKQSQRNGDLFSELTEAEQSLAKAEEDAVHFARELAKVKEGQKEARGDNISYLPTDRNGSIARHPSSKFGLSESP